MAAGTQAASPRRCHSPCGLRDVSNKAPSPPSILPLAGRGCPSLPSPPWHLHSSDPMPLLTCSQFLCELARCRAESPVGALANPAQRSKACKVHSNFHSGCPELCLPSPYLVDAVLTMVACSCRDCPCRSFLHEAEVFSGQGELVFPGSCSAPGYSKGVSGSVRFLSITAVTLC